MHAHTPSRPRQQQQHRQQHHHSARRKATSPHSPVSGTAPLPPRKMTPRRRSSGLRRSNAVDALNTPDDAFSFHPTQIKDMPHMFTQAMAGTPLLMGGSHVHARDESYQFQHDHSIDQHPYQLSGDNINHLNHSNHNQHVESDSGSDETREDSSGDDSDESASQGRDEEDDSLEDGEQEQEQEEEEKAWRPPARVRRRSSHVFSTSSSEGPHSQFEEEAVIPPTRVETWTAAGVARLGPRPLRFRSELVRHDSHDDGDENVLFGGHLPTPRSRSGSVTTRPDRTRELSQEEKDARRERTRANFRRIVDRVRFANKVFFTGAPPYHRFVPRMLYRFLSEHLDTHTPFENGTVEHGAVLFADCSGFTKLTSQLAKKGKDGAEQLCDIFKDFFQLIIDIAHKYKGDVIKFAGDAVTIVWFKDDVAPTRDMHAGLTLCARHAAICALKMLESCPYVAIDDPDPAKRVELNLHIGLGAGSFTSMQVGGVFDSWEYVLAGPPLTQISISEPAAMSGQVVASPEVVDLLGTFAEFTQPDVVPLVPAVHKGGIALSKQETGRYLGSFRRLMNADETGIQIHAFKEPVLSHALGFRLSRYVPKVVRAKMDRSRKPYDIAELRQVSVMFVKISGLSLDPDANGTCMTAVKNAQLLMTELQRVVFNYEGVVNKLLVDDKGLLALVVFGLPPFLHQDDAARAVRAGIDIANDVPRLDTTQTINASVGIATGHVFAGIIGSRQRHEYTVMGDSVNKAARLMVTATAYGVVIDETTKRAVKIQVPSFQYDKLEDLTLKGFSKRAKAYHPHPLQDNTSVWMTTGMPARMDNMLFGREEDIEAGLKMLRSTYDKLGGLLYVKADVAMGTTPVAMKLTQEAKKLGMFVISPSPSQVIKIGDYGTEQLARSRRNISTCIASDNKWAIWREVLKTAFRRLKDAGVQSLRKWVIECLEPFDDQIDLTWTLPAVDRVLSEFEHFDPREDPPLKSTRRSSIIRDSDVESLIVRVMLGFVSLFPTFIALRLDVQKHDGHGALDHYSWQVTERLAAHCCDRSGELESPPVIILVMSEHHNEDSPFASYDVLRRAVSAGTLLPLKLLTKKQRLRWAAQCMSFMKPKDVVVLPASIPPPVTQLIDQRCGGHPWMIHKTISLMFSPNACGPGSGPAIQKWETGRIAIVTKDIGQVRVTEDMAKCLLSSYEALRGRLQLIVKTAAVMPAFSPEMVQALLPESPAHVLQRELDDLVERGILEHSNTVPRCVDNYWPSDRTTSYHYEFACKLQQRLIVDITPHSLVKHNRECFHARISKVTFSVMTIQAAWRRYLLRTKPKLEWLLNGQAPQPQPVYTTRVAQAVIQIMKGMQIMQGEDAAHKLPDSYAQLSVTRSRQRANTNWLDMEAAIMGISGDDDGTSSDAGTNAMSDDSQREALEQRSLAGADAVIDAVGEREGQGREGAETRRVRYASAGHERTDSVGSDSSSGGGAAAIHDFSDPEPLAAEREGQDNDGGGDDGNSESQLDLVSFDGDSECEEQWAGHGQSAAGADGAGDAAVVHRNASNDTAECDDDLEPGFHAPPVPIRRRITRSQSPTPYVIPAGLRQKLEARHLTVSTVGTERAKRTEIGIVTEAVTHLLIQANDRLVRIRKGCMDIDARMGAVTDQMDALSDAFQDMVARISAEIEVEDTESS